MKHPDKINTTSELFTPAVAELVAIGAAITANCEPCLRYHVREAEKLGVSPPDIARAVEVASRVKDAPHRAVLRLAARLSHAEPSAEAATVGACFQESVGQDNNSPSCGCSNG